jgi:bifunctional non-homologous end joining protein LigD
VRREEEFVIAGYTAPSGSCKHFGGLLLGAHRNGKLYYGKVGTGFSEQTLDSLSRAFRPLIRKRSPFVESRSEKDVTYLAPRLVAPVAFQEWTDDRRLRQPVFLGLRDDKGAKELSAARG